MCFVLRNNTKHIFYPCEPPQGTTGRTHKQAVMAAVNRHTSTLITKTNLAIVYIHGRRMHAKYCLKDAVVVLEGCSSCPSTQDKVPQSTE